MGQRGWMGGILTLASWEYHFIGEHENLVQHPGNYISVPAMLPGRIIMKILNRIAFSLCVATIYQLCTFLIFLLNN